MLGAATSRPRRIGTCQRRGEQDPHQRPHDEPAVDGEAAFPHGEDLLRIRAVVVPVEDHLVQARADETGQDRPLGDADEVVGGQPLAPRLAVRQPQAHHDGGRHEDAVPANDERADLERDGAGRVHDG